MATSEFWQRVSSSIGSSGEWAGAMERDSVSAPRYAAKHWMLMDALTILVCAFLATLYEFHTGPVVGARGFVRGTLFHGRSIWILLGLLLGFTAAVIITSRRLHLYSPKRLGTFLHEQR